MLIRKFRVQISKGSVKPANDLRKRPQKMTEENVAIGLLLAGGWPQFTSGHELLRESIDKSLPIS
ncbi:MAG TPA: hypothetical protein DCF97_14230 [Plesiomonas shigelloides]|nr:hypothetical protein [Plesiomonas shigelloides]